VGKYRPGARTPEGVPGRRSAVYVVLDERGGVPMKVEILYFDGCSTYQATHETLAEVLSEEGLEAEVELVAVNTDEEARRLRFPGSPTIRVDGRDPFPVPERDDWRLGCRVYATPEGLRGTPTADMIRAALG
jgi:hypothetical protein